MKAGFGPCGVGGVVVLQNIILRFISKIVPNVLSGLLRTLIGSNVGKLGIAVGIASFRLSELAKPTQLCLSGEMISKIAKIPQDWPL